MQLSVIYFLLTISLLFDGVVDIVPEVKETDDIPEIELSTYSLLVMSLLLEGVVDIVPDVKLIELIPEIELST